MATNRIVAVIVYNLDPVMLTAITGLEANLTVQMNLIISAPPAGYEPGSIKVLDAEMGSLWDGANFHVWKTFTYATLI